MSGHKHMEPLKEWQAMEMEAVLSVLGASREGLFAQEAAERLQRYGPNVLPGAHKVRIWQIVLRQFYSPLIAILLVAAIFSLLLGDGEDALFILIVVGINALLGGYQEHQAARSASGLNSLLQLQAQVSRDGRRMVCDARELVPGDIVWLESGQHVAADLRLLEVWGLEVDESFLTGESAAVHKQEGVLAEHLPVPDCRNMAFAGAMVLSGRAQGVVVATGASTQVGQIARYVTGSVSAKPPLIIRMERLTRQITVFILGFAVLFCLLLFYQGFTLAQMFFLSVALAVSAIPEGLPISLTVALSIATRRMAKRKVIVRKLNAVESLGSCTVIGSDKTGTLTVNEQTAKWVLLPGQEPCAVSGQGYNGDGEVSVLPGRGDMLFRLLRVSAFANEGLLERRDGVWYHQGDAMDVALLALCHKMGDSMPLLQDRERLEGRIPYESERKYAAAYYRVDGRLCIGVKGALETVLSMCAYRQEMDGVGALQQEALLRESEQMAAQGYRLLAFAEGEVDGFEDQPPAGELCFLGMVCFIDPIRPEAVGAVRRCQEAGVRVLMITGDHPATADTIARQLGIQAAGGRVATGKELEQLYQTSSFLETVRQVNVFARVSPIQKLQIVEALIGQGEFVAVTGDGVNDAPALRRANIGVAMGSGTDVAKEVGDMIIVDDNFSSIVAGIEEGRYAYDNVRKVIYLLLSTGAAEVVAFSVAVLWGLPIPLLAVQLLWLNLVTNGIQDKALAFEPGEEGSMHLPPRRPEQSIFDAQMVQQVLLSALVMGGIVFLTWHFLTEYTDIPERQARNLLFLQMVLLENLHVFNCRSETRSAFSIPWNSNLLLLGAVLLAQGVHISALYIPLFQDVLQVEPVSLSRWALLLCTALPLLLCMELFKWMKRRRS